MAKVNFGAIATDARGKVKGIVYSKNKSGAYVRGKVTPANPNTPAQTGVRTSFGALAQMWSGTLTDAQRSSWITYAATYPRNDIFGASINLSGLNMFISLNQVLQQIASAPELSAPASNVISSIPIDPASLSLTVSGGAVTFDQTAVKPFATAKFYVFATRPLPAGRTVQKNDFRYIDDPTPAASGFPSAIDVTLPYANKFGPFAAGQRVGLLVATVDTATGLTTVGTILQGIAP